MTLAVQALPALLSVALRPLPLTPLQPLVTALLAAVVRRHPGIFDRLGEHADKRFAIVPTDLPFAFLLEPSREAPRMTVTRQLATTDTDARIAGSLAGLIGLANGTFDGDALFFSRDLAVEGDVEAVVALRNAIDDAGVDLVSDSAACLGPFAIPFERALRDVARIVRRLTPDAEARRWS